MLRRLKDLSWEMKYARSARMVIHHASIPVFYHFETFFSTYPPCIHFLQKPILILIASRMVHIKSSSNTLDFFSICPHEREIHRWNTNELTSSTVQQCSFSNQGWTAAHGYLDLLRAGWFLKAPAEEKSWFFGTFWGLVTNFIEFPMCIIST